MDKILTLQTFDRTYLDKSYEWMQNPLLMRLMDGRPTTRPDQLKWFDSLKDKPSYKIWGLACNGVPAGACGLKGIDGTTGELFCYIGEQNLWGGIGNQIVRLIEEQANVLGLTSIHLKVLHENERAKALYTKSNFKVTGQDAKFLYMKKLL